MSKFQSCRLQELFGQNSLNKYIYFLSVLDKSAAVVGSSSIPSGVMFLGKGVKVESGLSSYSLLVILYIPNNPINI